MLEKLFYLQANLIVNSYSLSDLTSGVGLRSTISFPFDYSVELSVPYIVFILLDLSTYVISFILMLEYSRLFSSVSPGRLGSAIRYRGLLLTTLLLAGFLVVGCMMFSSTVPFPELYFFSGLYSISLSSQAWKVLMLSVWVVWMAFFTTRYPQQLPEVVILSSLSLGFSITLLSVNNFILLFLVIEGVSLLSYIMAAVGRQYGSVVSSVHYFIYGSMGSMLLLLGLVTLYANFKVISLSVWATFLESGALSELYPRNILALSLASMLIVVGLLVKFGAAPIHGWVIETYANLSYHIMWFFSLFIKLVMGLLVLRVLHALPTFGLVETLGLLSLIVGCLGALRQSEVKRLFAYGSVMHVGFLLVADSASFQVYLIAYVLSMIVVGLVITNLRLNGQEVIYLSDVSRALSNSSPMLLVSLVIGLLSVSGVPPLAGFWGKFSVILSILSGVSANTLWSFMLILVILSVTLVAFFYYFRLVTWICLGLDINAPTIASTGISSTTGLILLLLSALLFGFGYVVYMIYDILLLVL